MTLIGLNNADPPDGRCDVGQDLSGRLSIPQQMECLSIFLFFVYGSSNDLSRVGNGAGVTDLTDGDWAAEGLVLRCRCNRSSVTRDLETVVQFLLTATYLIRDFLRTSPRVLRSACVYKGGREVEVGGVV